MAVLQAEVAALQDANAELRHRLRESDARLTSASAEASRRTEEANAAHGEYPPHPLAWLRFFPHLTSPPCVWCLCGRSGGCASTAPRSITGQHHVGSCSASRRCGCKTPGTPASCLCGWPHTHTHTHKDTHTHTRSLVLTVHMVTPQALLQHAASLYKRERDLAAREERLQQQADALATKLPSLANSYDGAETPAMTLEVEQGPGTSDDSLDGVDEEVRASPGAHGLACQC